jgi:hypothetical protein
MIECRVVLVKSLAEDLVRYGKNLLRNIRLSNSIKLLQSSDTVSFSVLDIIEHSISDNTYRLKLSYI